MHITPTLLTIINTLAEQSTNPQVKAQPTELAKPILLTSLLKDFMLALRANNNQEKPLPLQFRDFPSFNKNLAQNLQKFIANLKQGTLENLLPKEIITQSKRSDSKQELKDIIKNFTHQQNHEQFKEWKSYTIPILTDNSFHQLNVFYKHGSKKHSKGQHAEHHFIAEMSLQPLGDFQLSGLCAQKNIQLKLTSSKALPDTIETTLQKMFSEIVELNDMNGLFSLHVSKKFMRPKEINDQQTKQAIYV
jgi:hypothetical protein